RAGHRRTEDPRIGAAGVAQPDTCRRNPGNLRVVVGSLHCACADARGGLPPRHRPAAAVVYGDDQDPALPYPHVSAEDRGSATLVGGTLGGNGRRTPATATESNQSAGNQTQVQQVESQTATPSPLPPANKELSRWDCNGPLNGIAFWGRFGDAQGIGGGRVG